MTFISLDLGKIVNIYATAADEPTFSGGAVEAAFYMAENGIVEATCSSSLDFATEYGFPVDNMATVLFAMVEVAEAAIAQAGVDFIRFNLEKADEEEACKQGRFGRNNRLTEVLEQGGEVGVWALMKAK